jgi:Protein of unknown function (DUF3223).
MENTIKAISKKSILDNCKSILHKYQINSSVSLEADYEFLLQLFAKHPHFLLKKGCGIKDIIIKFTEFKNRCFYIIRTDGTQTDISYLVCVNGQGTKKKDISFACRSAIRDIIVKFRDINVIYGVTKCPITNEVLTKDNTHIDHYNLSFNELFEMWIKGADIDILHSNLNITTLDCEHQIYFTDNSIIEHFRKFHNDNTHLRAVSSKANLYYLKV